MSDHFNSSAANTIDRDARNMQAAGIALSGVLNDLYATIAAGNIGITANAWDVDSLALGGGAFSRDLVNNTGLVFAYLGGRIMKGLSVLTVSGGSLTLPPSTTSYIEVDPATGTVSTNTSAFTAGRVPLYTVTTGVATIATATNAKALLAAIGLASIVGSQLSLAASTKSIEIPLSGSISATTSISVICPDVAAILIKATFATATAVAANDTNYWTLSVVNKGPAGTGTTAMLAATDSNTTKATGGSAMSSFIKRDATLHGTAGNLITAAGDVLVFTLTATGSPTAMTQCVLRLDLQFTA